MTTPNDGFLEEEPSPERVDTTTEAVVDTDVATINNAREDTLKAAEEAIASPGNNTQETPPDDTPVPEYVPVLTVTMEKNPLSILKNEKAGMQPLFILRAPKRSDLEPLSDMIDDTNPDKATKETIEYISMASLGSLQLTKEGLCEGIDSREGSTWVQTIVNEKGERLFGGVPNFETPAGAPASGLAAVNRIVMAMQQGSYLRFPFWHSGYWLTFRPPKESEMLALEDAMAEQKITLAQETYGLSFKTDNAFMLAQLVDFIAEHVYASSVSVDARTLIMKHTRITDIPLLAATMANTIYPAGYAVKQPCIANPKKCNHIADVLMNIAKIRWEDSSALTKDQLAYMSARGAGIQHSVDELIKYQQQGRIADNREVKVNDKISVVLKTPMVGELIEAGHVWLAELRELAVKALTAPDYIEENSAEDRIENQMRRREYEAKTNARVHEYARLAALRQYTPWIKSVSLDDGTVVDNPEDLNTIMQHFSADENIVSAFATAVKKFMNDSTISMIAIPNIPCPSCQQQLVDDTLVHPSLIPLDAVSLFFYLRDRRINQARNSDLLASEM